MGHFIHSNTVINVRGYISLYIAHYKLEDGKIVCTTKCATHVTIGYRCLPHKVYLEMHISSWEMNVFRSASMVNTPGKMFKLHFWLFSCSSVCLLVSDWFQWRTFVVRNGQISY